jgi:hypothetical protein
MRSSFDVRTGLPLAKGPNLREQAQRRRILAICAMLGLALASAGIGALTADGDDRAREVSTGPFSYLSYE